MKGLFISFEGNDGSGKSSVIRAIYQKLLECGYDVILSREPGGSKIAEKIREEAESERISSISELSQNKDILAIAEIATENQIKLENSTECKNLLKHIDYLSKIKCEKLVCLEIRNHIAWYLKGLKNCCEIKEKIYKVNKVCDIINILNEFKEEFYE